MKKKHQIKSMSTEELEVIKANINKRDLENKLFEGEAIKSEQQKTKRVKTEEEKQQSKERKMQRTEAAKKRREEAEERIKLIRKERRKQFLQEVAVDVSQENNYYNKVMERIRDNGGVVTKEDNYARIIAAQDVVQERQIKMLQAIKRMRKQETSIEGEEQEL